jgi:enamine deaminase RidA (YjgF/YER057c/UK114 family)
MTIERMNPPGLAEPAGYTHVVIATGTRRVYVAGQTGAGSDGKVVGADHRAQAAQALRNVTTALEAAGAGWDDVVAMNILVVDHGPDALTGLFAAVGDVFGDRGLPVAASTYFGVQALFDPSHLVEINVTAEA